MTVTVNWGPRAGFAGTGTVQSAYQLLDLIFEGQDDLTLVSLTSTAIEARGILNGQTITLSVDGSGFALDSGGDIASTGTINSFNYFVGTSTAASQSLATIDHTVALAFLDGLIDAEEFGDIDALEDYFSSQDWTFNGTREVDNFPSTFTSGDGVTLNFSGNDLFNLEVGNDLFFAGDGNDTVNGGIGFDTLDGGNGNDVIDGGSGADLIRGNAGNDSLIGGIGFDVIYGDAGNDTLDGGATPDRLFGGDGDDMIMAGSNFGITRDGAFGGAGNDTIYGQAGFDQLEGGVGNDLLDGGNQADNLFGGSGNDTMMGGQGLDRLFGGDDDDIGYGGIGTDGMFGERGNDTLYGEDGNDRFFGGSGNDMLFGGADNDTLYGGAGFDTIDSGSGNDILQGNFNADTFVFTNGHGTDTISDFSATSDLERIDLSGITAIVNFTDLVTNHLSDVTGGVLIDTGSGNSVMLNGVDRSDLGAADFIF